MPTPITRPTATLSRTGRPRVTSATGGTLPIETGPAAPGFIRQNFLSLPRDMLDAARIGGVGEFRIFFFVAVPLVLPAVAALAIILFLSSWDNHLWPLLVLSRPDARTAPVAFGALVGLDKVHWGALMVAAVVMTPPVLVVFPFLQRYVIAGIASGAVK